MNENEFCNVYIKNSFKLILVLTIISFIVFYIVKAQFSFTAASFLLQ